MKSFAGEYKSPRGDVYCVRRVGREAYRLYWRSRRSGAWYALPGYPDYRSADDARRAIETFAEPLHLEQSDTEQGEAVTWRTR